MNKEVIVYHNLWTGSGCIKTKLKVNDDNFIRETEGTITVKDTYVNNYDETILCELTYHKTIDGFINSQIAWFNKHIEELTELHNYTIARANSYRK